MESTNSSVRVRILSVLLHIALMSAVVVTIFILVLGQYKESVYKISIAFDARDFIINKAVLSESSGLPQIERLKELNMMLVAMKASSLYLASNTGEYDYAFTMMFILMSVLLAILSFLILRKGWDNTNDIKLRTTFLVTFFFATVSGLWPKVFNYKENSRNNLLKYQYYSRLQLIVYDLVRDNHNYIRDAAFHKLDSCVLSVSNAIQDNQDVFYDIYAERVGNVVLKPGG